ncbi:hypothetical protein D3C78_1903300 [compost metagenome]
MRGFTPGAIEGVDLPQVADDLPHRLVVQFRHQGFLNPVLQIQMVDLVGLLVAPSRPDVIFGLALVGPVA